MSRWHARLAELRSGSHNDAAHVQIVQNVQNPSPAPPIERFEQFEQQADTWTDAHEERAAIIEHDGGAPRVWAEALARLDPARPPADVPVEYWLRFIDACGHFLDGGWHEKAAALGWGPLELFGCDRNHPFGKVEAMGLLWRIGDYPLEALTRNHALATTPNGGVHFLRRRPSLPGQVLPWEIAGEFT
jgi:hypothetical protein